MKTSFFFLLTGLSLTCAGQTSSAQFTGQSLSSNVGLPFLLITPDARAAALGETGAATSADEYSNHWNASKLAFAEKKMGIGISYTPWLRALVPDINMAYVSFYTKIKQNQAIGASLRYFSLGTITTGTGTTAGQFKPNEFALDLSYSRKLSDCFSAGIALRSAYSSLYSPGFVPGRSVGVDVSGSWLKEKELNNGKKLTIGSGLVISNAGSKIRYGYTSATFDSPLNARLGGRVSMNLNDYNTLAFSCDLNNVLANNWSGGWSDQLKSTTLGSGLEYVYNNNVVVRAGNFFESRDFGARRYATFGVGIRYNVFSLDLAYLAPYNTTHSVLEHTLRFSLQFRLNDFGKS